jgi:hypothetical protein
VSRVVVTEGEPGGADRILELKISNLAASLVGVEAGLSSPEGVELSSQQKGG